MFKIFKGKDGLNITEEKRYEKDNRDTHHWELMKTLNKLHYLPKHHNMTDKHIKTQQN
jgi:hypothetical protein